MPNPYFHFKQFTVYHDRCAMKVTTNSCVFGAWVAREIQNAAQKIENVLDIGTGTGLLSLLIAQKNEVEIDAVEIDRNAFEQAEENVSSSPWGSRIQVFNADILQFGFFKKYDCIISNPPFYQNELASAREEKNMAHHSQQLTISAVLDLIKSHLSKEGTFFLLVPAKRRVEIENMFRQKNLHVQQIVFLRQSVNHSPFRLLIMGSNSATLQACSDISICDAQQQYTREFVDLLKDYYLHL